MKIYLARHGQSEWQVKPSANWDSPLTRLGHEQAKRLGEWLAEQHYAKHSTRVDLASLCASPAKRARQTAAYAAEALGLPLVIDEKLREADFHVSEYLPTTGTPLEKVASATLPDRYAAFKEEAQTALRGLVEKAERSNGSVLAVAHGGLIKTLLRLTCGSDSVSFRLYNTGVNLIEWELVRWHLVYLNRWDHLPAELRTL